MIPRCRPFCFVVALAAIAHSAKPDQVARTQQRLLQTFARVGLYTAPDTPPGCLEWRGTRKGDSVLFVPQWSSKPKCAEAEPVTDRWIMPIRSGDPRLIDGPQGQKRIELAEVLGHPAHEETSKGDQYLNGPFSEGLLGADLEEEMNAEPNSDWTITGGGGDLTGGRRGGGRPLPDRDPESQK